MSDLARNSSRFLPTLTEVVQPPDADAAKAQAGPDFEHVVQSVLQRLEGVIERRLAEELERVVREVVTEAMPALTHQHEPK